MPVTAKTVTVQPRTTSAATGRNDMKTVLYWITVGAAAGGLGGLLVGGIGGRLAMFLLRLTSDDSVRGIQSDDDFTIGRFDLGDTLSLLMVTTILGIVVGLIVVSGRPFLPSRLMPLAWGVAGATAGGGILIHQDGVDFSLLEPHWFAVALFVAIPAAGAGLIAWLTEVYPRFWWRKRGATGLAALPVLPGIIFFPLAIAALLVGALWWLVMRWPVGRRLPAWRPVRIAAAFVFAAVVVLGIVDLAGDIPAII